MSKYLGLGLLLALALVVGTVAQQDFGKYRKVEAYEVRPGVLMLPRYTVDNQLCEIGLERLHDSPGLIRLDSALSGKEIDQILGELVPVDQRGKPSSLNALGPLVTQMGHGMTTTTDFENVTIQIYGAASPSSRKDEVTVDDVLATVRWKGRTCR